MLAGSMALRYQVDPAEPLTFLDVKVGKQVSSTACLCMIGQNAQLPTCSATQVMAAIS